MHDQKHHLALRASLKTFPPKRLFDTNCCSSPLLLSLITPSYIFNESLKCFLCLFELLKFPPSEEARDDCFIVACPLLLQS